MFSSAQKFHYTSMGCFINFNKLLENFPIRAKLLCGVISLIT